MLVALAVVGTAYAVDPPASLVNPRNGGIETADAFWAPGNYNVRHTISAGPGQSSTTVVLTTDAANDLDPRMVAAPGGDVWVVWWRDGAGPSRVVFRHRNFSTGVWDSERLLGEAAESGRSPRIIHDGAHPWVAFQAQVGGEISVIAQIIIDGPDPIPTRTIVGSSSFSGGPDVQIHAESGHLWIDWIDDSTFVAWSEYESATGTWSVEGHDSYAPDSVQAARARVRTAVLN